MTIQIYTKPGCVQCNATKRAFENKGIDPEMIDVPSDQDAYDFIVGLGYQQVPVVVAGDSIGAVFDPTRAHPSLWRCRKALRRAAIYQRRGCDNP